MMRCRSNSIAATSRRRSKSIAARSRPRTVLFALVTLMGLVGLVATGAAVVQAPKFLPDDPIARDADDLPMPKPAEVEFSAIYDVFANSFAFKPQDEIPLAMNVSTLGEVPDSSWFTNRLGVHDLSIEELVRGPAIHDGPSGRLTVVSGKFSGITPGFSARDGRGDLYFIKLDPAEYPRLSTAADVIGSKFFYAFGYNVPTNYIHYIQPDELDISPQAEVVLTAERRRVRMQRVHLDNILSTAARLPDGRVRVVASLGIEGAPVGPFRFYGTRSDDANDIFPHQHRRELRGYFVLSALLNHDDSRSFNTLDTYVGEEGEGHLKHYLLDFSSTLGSGSDTRRRIAPQNPRAGNEYIIEIKPAIATALTMGIWERPWMGIRYEYPLHPEAGRIEADFFEPSRWKPEYPNPAFERMLLDDAFWATKIVARLTDEAIRAILQTGRYEDPDTVEFLARIIGQRRDKIVDYYFSQVNPLDGFRIDNGTLRFDNLGERAGLATAEAYEYEWFRFDNDTRELARIGGGETADTELSLPSSPDRAGADYLMVRLRTRASGVPNWHRAVDVYVRLGAAPSVVGIEREID